VRCLAPFTHLSEIAEHLGKTGLQRTCDWMKYVHAK